jgi:hypothetical protein
MHIQRIRFPTPETKIKMSIIGYNNGVLNEMQIRTTHSPVKWRIKHCINSTKEKYHCRQKVDTERDSHPTPETPKKEGSSFV